MKLRKKTKSFALALRRRARAATLLIALLCGVTGAWAQETLTVFDGNGTSQHIPMDSYDFDNYTKSECIIPASELTAMEGGTITAITFYANTVAGDNPTFGTANQKVFLKEVSGTTLSSYSGMADATVVFDGLLPMPTTSASGYTITFSQGYTYNGGNLLIGVYNDAIGKYNKVIWYGNNNQSERVSAYGYSFSSLASVSFSKQTFLPKTTFTYTPAPGTAVDLGLPSGKKWADRNVGAGSETGYGTYYAWSSSDIATAQWGNDWRMPTLTEIEELKSYTDHEWATIGGVNGMKFMKKTDHSVYIFLPATGLNSSTEVGTIGYYWTSTEQSSPHVYFLYASSSSVITSYYRTKTDKLPIRPVQMFAGSGTESSPYLIASTADWNNLVTAVNGGETYSGKYFKMTANVGTVSTWMTGTFSGTFDGYGNTLTVGYSATTNNCAPFGYLNGTVQNLKVAGNISTSKQYAGGLAAWVKTGHTANVTNCRVAATINSTYSGDGSSAGFVAYVDGRLNVTGCAFTGTLAGSNAYAWGGFVSYTVGRSDITNCLFAPASVTAKADYSATVGRNGGGTLNFATNFYYTQKFNTAQGIQARTIAAGDYVSTLAISGDATPTYDVSGITVYSTGISFNDGSTTTFYGGSGQTVSLALTHETRSGYQFKQYAASQGSLSGETTDAPTLTMPGATGETLYTTYTATAGPDGVSDKSGYAKLVDNDKSTKVCATFTSGVYIDFNTPNAIVPTGYVITTANDAGGGTWHVRSPKTWKLYGKLNEGDSWTVLDDVADGQLPDQNTADKSYSIANTAAYKYFRYEITAIKGSTELFQIAELQLKGYDAVVISAEYDPLYNATFADGIDNDGWSIDPTQQIAGGTVTVSYVGENKVKSVTVTKLALCSLSEVTSEHMGKIIGADGNVYASLAQAVKVTTAVGILGKVTETGHGLIMSLEDAPNQVWATIDGWASASYAGTTLKVLPDDDARGSNLPSYTTLGSTTVSNWAVATRADYTAIFTNLGSTRSDSDGITYDEHVNAYITSAGGTEISGENWSITGYNDAIAWRFSYENYWGARNKTYQFKVRPVLGF